MRQSERIAVDQPARLHPNQWSSLEVRVLDCSEKGFRAACDAAVPRGSVVRLEVPAIGTVDAQVEWRRGGQFGARFLAPIDLGRSGFQPMPKEKVLARLLVQRAAARASGLFSQEAALRKEILASLPVRSGAEGED